MKWVCADSAKAEQRAAKDYREKQEKAQQARDLSTQAAINEKLAGKKQIAIQPIKGYDENENAWDWFTKGSNLYSPYQEVWDSLSKKPESHLKTITEWLLKNPNYYSPHDEKWKSLENTPDAYGAIKDYFTSAKRISPTQFQLVVDSDSDMVVHTVIHLGRIAVDIGSMVALYSASGGLATASKVTSVAKGVEVSKNFLSEAATGGISLASDVATMIKDISEYSTEGKIIVTLGPKSTKLSDLIEWIVL